MPETPDPPPAPVKQPVTPTKIWRAYLQSLLSICNISRTAQLPKIWSMVAPLKKDRARSAIEAAC